MNQSQIAPSPGAPISGATNNNAASHIFNEFIANVRWRKQVIGSAVNPVATSLKVFPCRTSLCSPRVGAPREKQACALQDQELGPLGEKTINYSARFQLPNRFPFRVMMKASLEENFKSFSQFWSILNGTFSYLQNREWHKKGVNRCWHEMIETELLTLDC